MHAFAILTVTSAEHANILIRDGLNICEARVRPTKQKVEPVQCMKCRNWGHFAGDCLASEDTCSTCRGKHCTNTCQNRRTLWCITCKSADHASWDRNCPKFSRCCYKMDKRNPKNNMPYFPTEQEWSQMVRPNRINMDERFPGMYAVNSLPLNGTRQPDKGPWKPRGRSNAPSLWNAARQESRPAERTKCSYPNTIPVDRDSRQAESRPGNNMVPDIYKHPNWMDEIVDHFTTITTNIGQATLRAG